MDRGIWATWYDLQDQGRDEYLAWLHGKHLPEMLKRPGYLWAAHIQNNMTPQREESIHQRLVHTTDPAIPTGNAYLLLFGAENPHVFLDPSPSELGEHADEETHRMLRHRSGSRYCVFVEVERGNGPEVKKRAPGITPGPVVQLGTFNSDTLAHEDEISTWYSRSRLPLMAPMPGCIGARKLVSVSGWAKHAILYEFTSMEMVEQHFTDHSDWSAQVVTTLVHAPHSPSLGMRIWP